jgi:hypothetical protein
MEAKGLTPILNVSDIASTFGWFEKWGWKKSWDWGTPPTFGAVESGKETCIFLCQGAQGRGRGVNTTTFQRDGDEEGDKGVWMSVWVDDVDEMHQHTASPPGWRSHFRLPTCRGTSARCTFATPMAMCSVSAGDSSPRSSSSSRTAKAVGESRIGKAPRVSVGQRACIPCISDWAFFEV